MRLQSEPKNWKNTKINWVCHRTSGCVAEMVRACFSIWGWSFVLQSLSLSTSWVYFWLCKPEGAERCNRVVGVIIMLYVNHGHHCRVLVWIWMIPLSSSGKTRATPSTSGRPLQPVSYFHFEMKIHTRWVVLRLTQSLSPVQTVIPQGLMIVAQTTGASVWVVSGHLNQPWLEMKILWCTHWVVCLVQD